jgi:hypothetical protein
MRNSLGLHRYTRRAEDGTQRTQWIEKGNPRSVGLDIASTHSRPFVGTLKGTGNRTGRKRGQIFR